MFSLKFNPNEYVIIIDAEFTGRITSQIKLVLDTGASSVVLPWKMATALGLIVDQNNTTQMTTLSMVETVPKVIIPKMTVLGKTVKNVVAIIKDLPPESPADGLLGLSYLKHFKLTIDFKKGELSLD